MGVEGQIVMNPSESQVVRYRGKNRKLDVGLLSALVEVLARVGSQVIESRVEIMDTHKATSLLKKLGHENFLWQEHRALSHPIDITK